MMWVKTSPFTSVVCVLAVLAAGVYWMERLRDHVYARADLDQPVRLELAAGEDMEWIEREGWAPRILSSIKLPENLDWKDEKLLARVAEQMAQSCWVSNVEQVVKMMDGTVRIVCDVRRPIAMIYVNSNLEHPMLSHGFIPVDAHGVRLPEEYENVQPDDGWMRIFGVDSNPPDVGKAYEGSSDGAAAVKLAELLFKQDYAWRISAIDVTNYRGRRDRAKSHIVLRTRSGGEIIWGSALGEECEELAPSQKIQNIALFFERGSPNACVQVNIDPNGWREVRRGEIMTADSSSALHR